VLRETTSRLCASAAHHMALDEESAGSTGRSHGRSQGPAGEHAICGAVAACAWPPLQSWAGTLCVGHAASLPPGPLLPWDAYGK
jgi:hypothetical protein